MSNEVKSNGWFKREVRLDNVLIIVTLIGGIFTMYGKWTLLNDRVDRHEARMERIEQTQETTAAALQKLTVIVDERTARK